MKKLMILLIFISAILTFSGCKFEQRKIISGAKKFIKNEYIPLLHDHKSYELAKIEISDTIFLSDLENLIERLSNLNNEAIDAIKKVRERRMRIFDDQIKKVLAGRSYYQEERNIKRIDDQISNVQDGIRKNSELIKKFKEWSELTTSEGIVYISINHEFRAKNQMGGVVLDEHEILYFPKEKRYLID